MMVSKIISKGMCTISTIWS